MTAQAILYDLANLGVILSANGDHLDVDGPDEALTDEVLAILRENKADLLELLTSDSGEPIETCPVCGRAVEEQRGKRYRHIWCSTGHFDA